LVKKSTFGRDFTIGVASSIVASLVVMAFVQQQIAGLKAELGVK